MDPDEMRATAMAALGVSELEPLRVGGQKEVYTATLEGVDVAVKLVVVPDTAYSAEAVERARREVDLLSRVDSDHVVKVLSDAIDIGERPEAVCWAEEWLDGEDVADVLHHPWSPEVVWTLVEHLGLGLAACHELDVVHRDLSPGNVRRRTDGRFVLMDPGFARHLARTAITGLFQPGTPGYLTPEHIPGGQPTPASDVFGIGILAYQALTGELPIQPVDDAAYFEQLKNGQVASVATVREGLPDDLVSLVDRCLQRQPARRYLDAEELLNGLPSEAAG